MKGHKPRMPLPQPVELSDQEKHEKCIRESAYERGYMAGVNRFKGKYSFVLGMLIGIVVFGFVLGVGK
ncbi:MAG: hypothetical protein KBC57_03295 [Neisseriaceae bacterium]|nr:hypothetical protein [Neisseriaceae bacterium]